MVYKYLHWIKEYYKLVNNGPAMVSIYSDQKNTVVKLQCSDIVIVIYIYTNWDRDGLVMTNFNENER